MLLFIKGICTETYEGFYFIWLSYYVSAAGILFASFFLWSLSVSKDLNDNTSEMTIENEDDIFLASNDTIELQEVNGNYDSYHTPLAQVTIVDKSSAPIEPLDEYIED